MRINLKKNIPKLVLTLAVGLFVATGTNTTQEVEARQPSTPSGFSTVQGDWGISQYNVHGHTFMYHDTTTMLARGDAGHLRWELGGGNRMYNSDSIFVDMPNRERRIRGSIHVALAAGGTDWANYDIRITPANFSSLSTIRGRSFVDNLYEEGTVTKSSLDARLANGTTDGFIGTIISGRTINGANPYPDYPTFKSGHLWKDIDEATDTPGRIYVRSNTALNAPASGWSAHTQTTISNMFGIRASIPSIDDDPPEVTFSPNGTDGWSGSNVSVNIGVTDTGTGVRRWRMKVETVGDWGGWSSWRYDNGRSVNFTAEGTGRLEIEAEDNAGNVGTTLSKTYRIDKSAPRPNTPTITNVRYVNGNDYWVRPGDTFNIQTSAYDDLSGVRRHYVRLSGDGNDNRAQNNRSINDNHFNEYRTEGGYTNFLGTEHVRTGWTSQQLWTARANTNSAGRSFWVQSFFRDAIDNNNGSFVSSHKRIRVDGTAPTISANLTSRDWDDSAVNVNLSYSDSESGVATRQFIWSTSMATPSNWHTYTGNASVSTNGTWYLHARAVDNAGNARTVHFGPYHIDTTAPTGTISGNPSNWTNQDVTLTMNASDALSGVRRIRRPNGTWVNGTSASQTVSANGTYTFRIEDNVGNTRDVSTTVNRIDKSTPSYISSEVYDARYVSGNDHWFRPGDTFRVQTVGSDSVSRMLNNFLRLYASDNDNRAFHNWNGASASAVNEFSSGNFTEITGGSRGTYNTTAQYTFNGRILPNAGNRTFNVQYYFRDNAGNNNGYHNTGYRIRTDGTPPTITANTGSRGWDNTDVTVSLTHADEQSGIATRQFAWSTSTNMPGSWTNYSSAVTQTNNGAWYLHARAVDNVGHVTTERFGPYRIDKTAPNGTISGNPTSWTNQDVTLSLHATDSGGSGVRRIQRPDGTWVSASNTTYTVGSNGTYTFRIEDHAGNTRDVSAVVNRIDKMLPSGSISGNPTSWTNQDVTLSFSGTDSGGSGVRRVRRPDGTWVNGSNATFTATSNGTYTFRVEDHAGNTRDVSATVNRIDKSAPNGTISGNPTSWTNQNATLTFAGTDTGGSGVRRVRTPDGTWVNSATVSYTVTSNGTYTFRVEDHAGNTRDVSVTVNRIDKSLPNGSISGNATNWTNQDVTLSFTASDNGGSGIRRVRRPNGTWVNGDTTTHTVSANGTYTFRAEDNAGNVRDFSVTVNRIDKVRPEGSISGNPTSWTNQDVTLSFNATDSGGSGVRRVRRPNGTWVNGSSVSHTVGSNGTYTFRVEDHAGNTRDVSVNVTRIDKTTPAESTINIPK